jgi:hypothetical protein
MKFYDRFDRLSDVGSLLLQAVTKCKLLVVFFQVPACASEHFTSGLDSRTRVELRCLEAMVTGPDYRASNHARFRVLGMGDA